MKEWQQLYTPALLSIPQMAVGLTLCALPRPHQHTQVYGGKRFFEAYMCRKMLNYTGQLDSTYISTLLYCTLNFRVSALHLH